jgi:hypothetical protein|uniref:Uncharacterized protein n=1 Tax=viral metagenome TaxID=1070528 RepID=A0A6C0IL43_9ZZZZ
MSFRKIGGINRSSKNHIVTSEYAASSTLVSKEIGGDYSDDSVIIYNSDICGNINVSVDKNILALGTLTIHDDISGFSTLDISGDMTGHSNLLIHDNITGYKEMDISGHIRGHDDLTIFGDISGHGTLDIGKQITGHDTLTVYSDISGFSTLDISGDITGHSNLLIHKNITGHGTLDISENITGYKEQTIHGDMFGWSDLDISGEIRGHTRLLIDDPVNGPKLDVSNIVYSYTHIHGESTMEIMGDISGNENLFIENNITGHGTLDISGDMTGYSNLTIYQDISGYGTLDISGELRGHSRLLVINDSDLKLDVSNIVYSYTHIHGESTMEIIGDISGQSNLFIENNITGHGTLDISGDITGYNNLTIYEDISGYGTLDISGELRGHSRLLVINDSDLKLDVSNIVYSYTHIHGESTMEIMGDISGQNNLFIENNITGHGTLDISGDITGNNNLTIYKDISGYGTQDISGDITGKNNLSISFDISGGNDLDISNNIRGRNRLQIFHNSQEVIDISSTICGYKNTILKQDLDICGQIIGYSGLYIEGDISGNNDLDISNNIVARNRLQLFNNNDIRLDVSSSVFAYTNVTVSGEIEGTQGLTIEKDIYGNGNLDISGNITGHKGVTIFKGTSLDKIIDISDSLVTIYEKLKLDSNFQANDISCGNIEVKTGNNIVLQNGNIDVSGGGYVHIRGANGNGDGLTVENNVLIKGNLTVSQGDVTLIGSTTKIHTTNLDVCDNIIEMHRLDYMAAGIIITNDSSGAVDDRRVFIGYNPSTTIGTSGVTQDAIIFSKIADTDISDNILDDLNSNYDNNLMWLKARGIDVQHFVVKEQSATVSEVQGLQHLHQTIIDGGLSANGQTVLNSTNIYNKLSFYELPDASNVLDFFDYSGKPQKILETNNYYYFIYDVSGEYTLQIQTGYNSASDSTSVGYIEYDYIVCGGGENGSYGSNGVAYGGDISFNYDNIDEHGIRDDATTYINVGGAQENTKIDISYNISYETIFEGSTTTNKPHAIIVDVSGGINNTSYNSQFEYAYDSYQFPDRANFKIQLGHAGDASYNFGIKSNYDDQKLDYSNNHTDYQDSSNGFYGSGAKPGGIGGDGVAVLIFKKENFVKMMVDRLNTYKYQEITHNTAYLMDVSAINLDVFNNLNVKKHAWIEDASINNLDVSNKLTVDIHATIFDASINNNLDVSENLWVNKHAWIEDASINNNLDVSNNLRVNTHATIFDASINNNLYVSNDLVVKTHATIFDASINNNLDVSKNLRVNTHATIFDASINNNLDVSNDLTVKTHAWIEDASINNNLDVSNNLIVKTYAWIEDASINNNLDVSNNLKVKTHAWIEDASINNLDVSVNLIVKTHATIFDASINNNLDVSENLWVNKHATIFDASINNNLDVSNNLRVNTHATIFDASINNNLDVSNDLRVNTHATIFDASINNNLDVSENLLVNKHATIFDASINNNLDVSENLWVNKHATIFDASINNNLDVSNNLRVNTHAIIFDASINNNLDVSENLLVNKHATIFDASINNNLHVNNKITTNDLDVTNHASIDYLMSNKVNISELIGTTIKVYEEIKMYDPDERDFRSSVQNITIDNVDGMKGLFEMDGNTNDTNKYDSSNNLYFLFDTSGNHTLKTQLSGLDIRYTICGGGAGGKIEGGYKGGYGGEIRDSSNVSWDGSMSMVIGEGGDSSSNYLGCVGDNTALTFNSSMIEASGGTIDTSYNSQFIYTYDDGSYNLWLGGKGGDGDDTDKAILNINTGSYGGGGGGYNVFNSDDEEEDDASGGGYGFFESSEPINFAENGSLNGPGGNGYYGGGGGGGTYNNDDSLRTNGGKGGTGVVLITISKQSIIDSIGSNNATQKITHNEAQFIKIKANTIDVSNITLSGTAIFESITNTKLNATDASINNLIVSQDLSATNHFYAKDASINNLDVSINFSANDASINHLDISTHLFAPEVSFNNLDVSNHLFAKDVSINNLDVSINFSANDASINHLDIVTHLFAPEVSFNNLDVSNHLFAKDVSINNLDVSINFNANDASINHLDIVTHLFAPDASINTLDVSNHLYANDASINRLDVSDNLYANDASINNLDVSQNLTVNGVATFNGEVNIGTINIDGPVLGINNNEVDSSNIGILMKTDSSNVFFGYDISDNMCFLSKVNNNIDNKIYDESDDAFKNSLINLRVNTLKANTIVNDEKEFENITVNKDANIGGNASVGNSLSVGENINCGKAIKLENNTFSVGSMVNVYKSGNIADLEADYNIYVTDKWAIYVFDNSGNYSMNLNVLEENGEIPDISLGYIICGGGEGGGTGTELQWGKGGAPGFVKYDFKDISSNGDIIFNITVGEGGETSEADPGGNSGTSSVLQINANNNSSFNFDASGGSDDISSTSNLISYNLNTLCINNYGIVPEDDGQFIIKLGGAGGDSNAIDGENITIIDASFGGGGGGGGGSNENISGGTSSEWGIKGTKKNKIVVNNELITSIDFELGISGENSGVNGGAGGGGNFGGGGGGGGFGGTGGTGGRGGDGVVCIIIDKAKFGSVIKDVEEIQCGTLDAFQIETTRLKTKSDYRLKTDVEDLQEVYNVDKLRPVMYNINSSKEIGLIAHEIQEYYPFLVSGVKDGKEMQTVNYTGLIGVLIKEIQLLKSVVREQAELVKEQAELVREQGNEIKLLK